MASSGPQFAVPEAARFWGGREMAWKKLRLLEHKGWIARLERGKYLVIPLEAGPNRTWTQDSYLIATVLVQPAVIAYWTALRHWNWTEQMPRIVYVQTTKRKSVKRREVFGVLYEFVTVNQRKFYGHKKVWRDGKAVLVTDKEKTLVDCADDVERAGTIEELAKAVKAAAAEISWEKLGEYVRRFPNGAVKKRLGYLFETVARSLPKEALTLLESWQRELSAGVVPLQPSRRRTGKVITRWRIRVNAEVA
jgi:predicted transcriptional regulator of viral defense system